MIPVLDLFAGPGGLSEGFSALKTERGEAAFRIALSIEKELYAHQTLKLRSFFRQFSKPNVPEEYYDHLRGKLNRNDLYARFPNESSRADLEAWHAELGNHRKFRTSEIDEKISRALNGANEWVLVGGPPCQAYSVVGRSRVIPVDPEKYERDPRHFLYKAYLRIIAEHRPSAFVLENVRGILTARVGGKQIIDRLLLDLQHPSPAARGDERHQNGGLEYKIYPLADYSNHVASFDPERGVDPARFIVQSEKHRIPQARHRFILVGVRSDLDTRPSLLHPYQRRISLWEAIHDLPRIRSRLSAIDDSGRSWVDAIRELAVVSALHDGTVDEGLCAAILSKAKLLTGSLSNGASFIKWDKQPSFRKDWFHDERLGGICNHASRRHMKSDLWRYFFASSYAAVHNRSPKLPDFPSALLPDHANISGVNKEKMIFEDRFRVQVRSKPATTVTCHIGKDGHYFIHPDPLQCRSLTVREAARLQTFPDNYFFSGPVTAQYRQVGNAVPPLLAYQIARIVYRLFSE